jgi:hypothetical protein
MRICKICKAEKELKLFQKRPNCLGGRRSICTRCANSDPTKHYNSPEYRKEKSLQHRINNFESNMLSATKSSAKKRGLEFNLTIEDIVIPEACPYLGFQLTRNVGRGKSRSNPSVDRIDNNKGYVKGNIMIISDLANTMKRECSIDQLITFAKNTLKIHS